MPELLCKICGLIRPEDATLCHSLGADFIGFIFVPASPRFVTPQRAAEAPDGPALKTGVFAAADLAELREIARRARLDFIQLHGGEEPAFCRAVGPERVIKTLWPEKLTPEELEREMERFAPVCAYFLFDAGTRGGGSGKSLNTDVLPRALLQMGDCAFPISPNPRHAKPTPVLPPRPWLLAGGLGPENLLSALAVFAPKSGPSGVDMNSALEIAPGVKDHELVRRALALAKGQRPRAH